MQLAILNELISANMRIMAGKISNIKSNGEILVKSDCEGFEVCCEFLRTSAGPPPKFDRDYSVLFVVNESQNRGYILGLIEKYLPEDDKKLPEVESPSQNEDTKEIKLNATEMVELRCGESSLTMNKDGKIVLKGSTIVSRASGVNKVKGSTVRIN